MQELRHLTRSTLQREIVASSGRLGVMDRGPKLILSTGLVNSDKRYEFQAIERTCESSI